MKKFLLIIIPVFLIVVWASVNGYYEIKRHYTFENKYSCWWDLADRSSSIKEKSFYIDKFVGVLDKEEFKGSHNAVFYKTTANSFDSNLRALKSLQDRLREIQSMDVKSFEYQTAIQQITAQEQGEASNMLDNLYGVWHLKYYPLLWGWVGLLNWVLFTVSIFFVIFWIFYILDEY